MNLATLEKLADNIYIVLAAYLCVFVPWTAISLRQFITSEWKPLRVCRHDAIYHMGFVLVPMPYLIFYIVIQAISGDFKEMAGAVVALTFCAHHAARTTWTLWQLRCFYSWIVSSIEALRSHGILYKPLCQFTHGSHNNDAKLIADCILVNDSVVDTELLHGSARCYLTIDQTSLVLRIPPHLSTTRMFFHGLYARLLLSCRFLVGIFRVLFRIFRSFRSQQTSPASPIRPVPHEPIELWITWVSVFVAQGLSHWVAEFKVAEEDISLIHSKDAQHFSARRDYYAAEILAAAVHVMPPCSTFKLDSPNPYFLSPFSIANDKDDIRFQKQEMLRQALSEGHAFPYGEPHFQPNLSNLTLSDKHCQVGYKSYAVKLRTFLESLPSRFPTESLDFDVEKLEWLTIFLHFGGRFNRVPESKSVSCSMDAGIQNEDFTPNPVSEHGIGDYPTEVQDLAVQNLLTQLGHDTEALDIGIEDINRLCAYPFNVSRVLTVSKSNRLVLQAGYQIDVFIALASGADILFLQRNVPNFVDHYSPNQHFCAYDERGPIMKSFDSDSAYQKEIEKSRLDFTFVNGNAKTKFMEISLNFMGHSMELVRTKLAKWVENNYSERSDIWAPELLFTEYNSTETTKINLGHADTYFSQFIYRQELGVAAASLWAQSRIICALQQACFEYLGDDGGPSSIATIALCILSFPSLSVKSETCSGDNSDDTSTGQKKNLVHIDTKFCKKTLSFLVIPLCAPQQLAVHFTLQNTDISSKLSMALSLQRTSDCENISSFSWDLWRKSFSARCSFNCEWKSSHDLQFVPFSEIDVSLNLKCSKFCSLFLNSGEPFLTWKGWPPFRHFMILYELLSNRFLMEKTDQVITNIEIPNWFSQHQITRPLVAQNIDPINYCAANRSTLRFATRFIHEILADRNASIDNLSRFQKLVETDFEGALNILEVGAVREKSEECLNLLVKTVLNNTAKGKYVPLMFDVLQRYVSQILSSGTKFVSESSEKVLRLLHLYENIFTVIPYDPNAVLTYGWLFYSKTENLLKMTPTIKQRLRSVLLRTNDFSILPVLAVLMTCNEKPWECASNVQSLEKITTSGGAHVVKANIVKNKRYSHWKNIMGKRFSLLSVRRATEDEGDHISCLMLATYYFEGQYVRKDWASALHYYEKCVNTDLGSVAINGMVTILTRGGFGVKKDIPRAKNILCGAYVKFQNPSLLTTEANMLLRTQIDDKSKVCDAVDLYKTAVEKSNNSTAALNLASIYLYGKFGIEKHIDYGKKLLHTCLYSESIVPMELYEMWFLPDSDASCAFELFNIFLERIVKLQCNESMVRMAHYLERGIFVEQNCQLSFQLLQTAMWNQSPSAATELGNLYARGNSYLAKDEIRAEELLRYNIDNGYSKGKISLSQFLLNSASPQKRRQGVTQLEELVGNHSDLWAMYALAKVLIFKDIVPRDLNRAIKLLGTVIEKHSVLDPIFEMKQPTLQTLHLWLNSKEGVEIGENVGFTGAVDLFRNNTETDIYSDSLIVLSEIYSDRNSLKDLFNARKATSLLQKALIVAHHPDSLERLAVKLMKGSICLDKDSTHAEAMLERVIQADPDNVSAKVRLAGLCSKDEEVVYNPKKSRRLYEEVIADCKNECTDWHVNAVVSLAANLLDCSEAEEQNVKRALDLLESFAIRFKPEMVLNYLGRLYLYGSNGVEPNLEKAKSLHEQNIAENGSTESMLNLGVCLIRSAEKDNDDLKKAFELIETAHERGYPGADLVFNVIQNYKSGENETNCKREENNTGVRESKNNDGTNDCDNGSDCEEAC